MFESLEHRLKGKTIVLLGESAHGVREYNSIRTDLIRWLHERLGFDALIMESAIGPLVTVHNGEAMQVVKKELHEVYHTAEVMELIRYALDQKILLAGIEIAESDLDHYRHLKRAGDDYGSRSYRDEAMYANP